MEEGNRRRGIRGGESGKGNQGRVIKGRESGEQEYMMGTLSWDSENGALRL